MPDWNLVTPAHVRTALEECDRLGSRDFVSRYGFRNAHAYRLWHRGAEYDATAVLGVAYLHATGRPATWEDFPDGQDGAAKQAHRPRLRRRGRGAGPHDVPPPCGGGSREEGGGSREEGGGSREEGGGQAGARLHDLSAVPDGAAVHRHLRQLRLILAFAAGLRLCGLCPSVEPDLAVGESSHVVAVGVVGHPVVGRAQRDAVARRRWLPPRLQGSSWWYSTQAGGRSQLWAAQPW